MKRIITWILAPMAVIAILCAVPASRRIDQARQAQSLARIGALQAALENYHRDTGAYPPVPAGLEALRYNPGVRNWLGPYWKQELPLDPWGNPFVYGLDGDGRPIIADSSYRR